IKWGLKALNDWKRLTQKEIVSKQQIYTSISIVERESVRDIGHQDK
ncbi:transcription Lacl family protein, partial [Lacticaseibacillus rhamnosus MTCC 5462]